MPFVTFLLRLFVPAAYAASVDQLGASDPAVAGMWAVIRNVFPHTSLAPDAPWLLLFKVASFVLTLIGGVAVAVIVYAGIKIIMSAGDDSKISEGKKMLTYALVGVALAIASRQIVLYFCTIIIPAAVGGGSPSCPI